MTGSVQNLKENISENSFIHNLSMMRDPSGLGIIAVSINVLASLGFIRKETKNESI